MVRIMQSADIENNYGYFDMAANDIEINDEAEVDRVFEEGEHVGYFVDEGGSNGHEGGSIKQQEYHDEIPPLLKCGLWQYDIHRWFYSLCNLKIKLNGGTKQVDSLLQLTKSDEHKDRTLNLGNCPFPEVPGPIFFGSGVKVVVGQTLIV